jgi:hypothetical protein
LSREASEHPATSNNMISAMTSGRILILIFVLLA